LDAVVASAVKGFDAGAMVEGVVTAEVTKVVRKIVADALRVALTPERREQLAATAAEAVEAEFKTMTGETAAPASDGAEEVENHFPNVYAFVQDFLVKVHARPVRAQLSWHWCSQWWDHPEAVSRLEALWKAFELLRRDPGTGAATWWRDYAGRDSPPTAGDATGSSVYVNLDRQRVGCGLHTGHGTTQHQTGGSGRVVPSRTGCAVLTMCRAPEASAFHPKGTVLSPAGYGRRRTAPCSRRRSWRSSTVR